MTCKRVYFASTGPDPSMNFLGSSPYAGDVGATGIVLPPDPSTSEATRYLVRTAGFAVPPGSVARVVWIRQLVTIGTTVSVEQNGPDYPIELPVVDPFWHFLDGDVSWHLRRQPGYERPNREFFADTAIARPYSYTRDATGPAIVARLLPVSAGGPGYLALNGGVPYGAELAGLGTFRDLRYPWTTSIPPDTNLDIQVVGPCKVNLYASVYQTDPDRRPDPPVIIEGPWTRPEDSFVWRFPEARYWRVGAELAVDFCDSPERCRWFQNPSLPTPPPRATFVKKSSEEGGEENGDEESGGEGGAVELGGIG